MPRVILAGRQDNGDYMPTIRKIAPKRKGENRLPKGWDNQLTTGIIFTGDEPFESEEQRRQIWFRYRDRLMAEWMNEKQNAGKRPIAFWQYDLKRERPDRRFKEAKILRDMGLLEPWEIKEIGGWKKLYHWIKELKTF